MSDLSMLVFCFRSHTFVVHLRTTKVQNNQRFQGTHSTLSAPKIPPVKSPHAFGFPIANTPPPPPMLSEFHNREPPLPFGNPKSCPWYRYGYFLESPNLELICTCEFFQKDKIALTVRGGLCARFQLFENAHSCELIPN